MDLSFPSEAEFSNAVAEHLHRAGWKVEREYWMGSGWIDVFAERGSKKIAIEAKMRAKNCSALIRQIEHYWKAVPDAQFYFATPDRIPSDYQKRLLKHRILCYPTERIFLGLITETRCFVYSEEFGLAEEIVRAIEPGWFYHPTYLQKRAN
jgi:hypothetical protein